MKSLKQLKEQLFVSTEKIEVVERIYALMEQGKTAVDIDEVNDELLELVDTHYTHEDEIHQEVYDYVFDDNGESDYFDLTKIKFQKVKVNEVFRHGGDWHKKIKANSFVNLNTGKVSFVPADLCEFVVNIDKNDLLGETRFGVVNEDIPVNAVGNGTAIGITGGDPPVKRKKFAGANIFDVDEDTFQKARWGKKKYLRYDKYVDTNSEQGKAIHEFGRKYPKEPIIVKNNKTGIMMFLRRKEK